MIAGVLNDPAAPSSFGAWLSHAGTHHIGALAFLFADFFLFIGVAVLTGVQASQVCFFVFLFTFDELFSLLHETICYFMPVDI